MTSHPDPAIDRAPGAEWHKTYIGTETTERTPAVNTTHTTVEELVEALNDWQARYDEARQADDFDGGWNYWDVVEEADPALIDWNRAEDTPTTLNVPLAAGGTIDYIPDRGRWELMA